MREDAAVEVEHDELVEKVSRRPESEEEHKVIKRLMEE